MLFESQALRYPYFQVGQVLGAPQQIQDQGPKQPPQHRPDPPPQIPTFPLPNKTHQPPHHPEPPKRQGRSEVKTDRAAQSRFPQIHDKGLQSKVSAATVCCVWKSEKFLFIIELKIHLLATVIRTHHLCVCIVERVVLWCKIHVDNGSKENGQNSAN